MGLTKVKIGKLVETVSVKCGIPQCENVSGINIFKRFMPSRNVGADTSNYLIVPPGHFAFNLMHVGRDEKIPVAINDTEDDIIVSVAYFVFKVIDEETILKEYLNVVMTSPEFDRYAWFCTDSSIRGNLDWYRFCDIEIDVPPLPIQQKYVDVYQAMLANQQVYERGLYDLKLTCDAYIERLRRELPSEVIAPYIESRYEVDTGKKEIPRRGISIAKKFVVPKQEQNSARSSQIVRVGQFAYNTATTRNGETLSIAYCKDEDCAVPGIYQVFEVFNHEKLISEYLFMWFCRTEFDRYTRWASIGSAHEQFTLKEMKEVKIPIPDITVQQAIVNIHNAFITRRETNEKLKMQIKDICPILIKGSLEEAKSA